MIQEDIIVQINFQPVFHGSVYGEINQARQGCNDNPDQNKYDAFPNLGKLFSSHGAEKEEHIPGDKEAYDREFTPKYNSRGDSDIEVIADEIFPVFFSHMLNGNIYDAQQKRRRELLHTVARRHGERKINGKRDEHTDGSHPLKIGNAV